MDIRSINQATRDILLKELDNMPKKNVKILDLGSGKGDFSNILKDKGFEVYAADMANNPFKNNIHYKKCDFNKGLPYPKNFFDIVIAMEVIEHIENPWFFLDQIYKITKPKGLVIITTPNPENYVSRLTYLFLKRFVSFGPDLSYWNNTKNILEDKHRTPLLHVLFQEMIYQKFVITKYISNGVPPILERNIHWKNKYIGISKIYILRKK